MQACLPKYMPEHQTGDGGAYTCRESLSDSFELLFFFVLFYPSLVTDHILPL